MAKGVTEAEESASDSSGGTAEVEQALMRNGWKSRMMWERRDFNRDQRR